MSNGKPASKSEYESSIARFIDSDSMDLEVFLQGLRDVETARKWLGEANRINADTEKKEQIAERIQELKSG